MSVIVNISLLGFVPFEKTTFESFFKLAGRRDTVYKIVDDTAQAKIFLVNGDSLPATGWTAASLKPSQRALFVGKADPSGQWPTAPRPIRLTTVLGLLDVISTAEDEKPAGSVENAIHQRPDSDLPPKSAAAAVAPAPTARQTSVTSGYGRRRDSHSEFGASTFMGLSKPMEENSASQQYDEILVVDDSDVALKFMRNRLTRYGFRARLARSGEEALTRVATEKYKFVFMDVMMDGLDGYQTCRAIKQKKYPAAKAPVVVMLTSRGGSIDKIRGGLAGCDAYLTKPLNEAELLKILSKFDEQVERSFQTTKIGGSGISSRHSH
jgi:two-component system, cell cycle response regulator